VSCRKLEQMNGELVNDVKEALPAVPIVVVGMEARQMRGRMLCNPDLARCDHSESDY